MVGKIKRDGTGPNGPMVGPVVMIINEREVKSRKKISENMDTKFNNYKMNFKKLRTAENVEGQINICFHNYLAPTGKDSIYDHCHSLKKELYDSIGKYLAWDKRSDL